MAFPSAPNNNDTYTVNGVTYVYDSSLNTWTVQLNTSLSDDIALLKNIANTTNASITYSGDRANSAFIKANASTIKYTTGTTPPAYANVGEQWYYTSGDILFEYINDGTSSSWVDISTPSHGNTNISIANILPSWNTSTRPSGISQGFLGRNTDYNTVEMYSNTAFSNSGTIAAWTTIANGPTFYTYGASQTLAGGTATIINLTTKTWDTANCFNNTGSYQTMNGLSVPPYSFMPPIPGFYHFDFSIRKDSITGEIVSNLVKNGTNTVALGTDIAGFSSAGSGLVYLNGVTDSILISAWVATTSTSASRTAVAGQTYGMDTFLTGYLARGI